MVDVDAETAAWRLHLEAVAIRIQRTYRARMAALAAHREESLPTRSLRFDPTAAALLGRANLTGLVLGCIEAKFCKKICV